MDVAARRWPVRRHVVFIYVQSWPYVCVGDAYSDIMLRRVAAACSCTSGSALLSNDTTFGLPKTIKKDALGNLTEKGRGNEHCAGFHESSLDLRMKGKVADRGDAILQHHALACGQQLDEGRQYARFIRSQFNICENVRSQRRRPREQQERVPAL
jgi:hypothetical protein